ncbi:MAG: UvrD-helicase domain-containing protein [Planctomycetia bacterium]|nr:UvrD-helicase domain-containing protein [Planctomycetia bacterium]
MNGVFILLGGPGTGKTTVALHRIPYLIFEHRSESQARANERRGVDHNRSDFFSEESLLVVVWKEHLVPYLQRCVRDLHLTKTAEGNVNEIQNAKLGFSEDELREFIDGGHAQRSRLNREFVSLLDLLESELQKFNLTIKSRLGIGSVGFTVEEVSTALKAIRDVLPQPDRLGRYPTSADRSLRELVNQFHDDAMNLLSEYVELLYAFYESPTAAKSLTESHRNALREYVQKQRENRLVSRVDRFFLLWLIHFITDGGEENAKHLKSLPRFSHVMIDEAQYYEPIALRLLADLASLPDGVMTIVGDLEQRISSKGGVLSWDDFGIEIPRENVRRLETNYRSSRKIFDFLEKFKSVVGIAEPLKRPFVWHSGDGYEPHILTATDRETEFDLIINEIAEVKTDPSFDAWSLAVVLPSSLEAFAKETLVPKLDEYAIPARWATGEDVKESVEKVIITDYDSIVGLEFDAVFVAGVDELLKDHAASRGTNAVWVALSRARQFLRVSRVGREPVFDSPAFAGHRN